MKYIKKFESKSSESEVLSYIKKCLKDNKNDYKSKSKWSDRSWLIDELINFIGKEFSTSYVYSKFFSKYTFDELEEILIKNFKSEFEETLNNYYYMTLDEYLMEKDIKKYNL